MRPANILSTIAAITLLAAPVLAQDNKSDKNTPTPANTPSNTAGNAPASTENKASPSPSPSKDNGPPPGLPTPSPKTTPNSSPSPSPNSKDSKQSSSSVPSPTLPSPTLSTPTPAIPKITSPGSPSDDGPTGLPTLTGKFGIPTYPPAAVPPTKNAPFMQQSSAPDGTVFIAVGAILGAFGVAILLWRAIVSLLLHRSVRRAAMAQHDANSKAGFPAPPAPFYKYSDHNSPAAGSAGRGARRTNRATGVPSATPSTSNLFFSPTAVGSNGNPGARGSAFLPSGFYAAGTSSPGGQQGHSISLTNLRPESTGQNNNSSRNTLSQSPPDSPRFTARRDVSNSSLNPHQPGQRAPSAYLDDLLADEPGSLPPPQMPQSHSSRHSGRY